MTLAARFLVNLAALWVAAKLLSGVSYAGELEPLALAALVLTIANWLVKPVLTILALPAIILTFGIALFFVNLAMIALTAKLVDDFSIDGFWSAVGATIVVWAVNAALHAVVSDRD
jgi:putative membrane protein